MAIIYFTLYAFSIATSTYQRSNYPYSFYHEYVKTIKNHSTTLHPIDFSDSSSWLIWYVIHHMIPYDSMASQYDHPLNSVHKPRVGNDPSIPTPWAAPQSQAPLPTRGMHRAAARPSHDPGDHPGSQPSGRGKLRLKHRGFINGGTPSYHPF